ncbi:MAG: S-layer homology domain-containing protein, partial [Patescibacteria group bacterium]
ELNVFTLGDTVYITLSDTDENIDGTAADTVSVTVTGGGDSETVTLTENSDISGVFRGSIASADAAATASDGTLQSPGTTLAYLSYTDTQDALSYADSTTLVEASTTTTTTTTTTTSGGGGGGGRARTTVSEPTSSAASSASSAPAVGVPQSTLPNVRGLLQVIIGGKGLVFKDIPVSSWFAGYVATVVEKSIASGYRDAKGNLTGVYGPANPVTYAEIAKMALEAAKKDVSAVSGLPKNASAGGQWSERYIKLAEDLKLSVYTQSLQVNNPAPRGAVLQTVLESLGQELDAAKADLYKDLPVAHPHARSLTTATRLGIISGDTDTAGKLKGTVRPNANINRAEVAKIMSKVVELGL